MIYLLTPVPGTPMWRLQGPQNTDTYVDTIGLALDAFRGLDIHSIEITASERDAAKEAA